MARIKCPHCGAGNRESREISVCWQCGMDLWEPVRRQTYALDKMPQMSSTQYIGGMDIPGFGRRRPGRWKITTAALVAALSALLLIAAVMGYIDSRSGSRVSETIQPGAAAPR